MRIFALSFLLLGALLSPPCAYTHELEEWQTKNFSVLNGEKTPEKKVSAIEISQLQSEIEQGASQKAIPPDLLNKYYLRDRMLKSFLQQRPVIGLRRDEVCKLLAECSPPPVGTLRPAQTRIFQIFDGTTVAEGNKRKPSIYLEVRFINDIAYAFRIKQKTFEKTDDTEEFSLYLNRPGNIRQLWTLKFFLDFYLPYLVAPEAELAGITEASVTRKCHVQLSLSTNGTISNVRLKRSSLNPKFDSLVVDAVKRLSGKPGLRSHSESGQVPMDLETEVELLVKESSK